MFGRRKKKYIKNINNIIFKTSDEKKADYQSLAKPKQNYKKPSLYKQRKPNKKISFISDQLIEEDTYLVAIENSWFEKVNVTDETWKKAQKSSMKPATGSLNLISVILVIMFGHFLLNAEFLKVNSIAYILLLIIPFIFGKVILFSVIFYIWKKKLQPIQRIVLRMVFKYRLLIFFGIYFVYIANMYSKIM